MSAVILPASCVRARVARSPVAAARSRSVRVHASSVNSRSESVGSKRRTTACCLAFCAASAADWFCVLSSSLSAPFATSARQIATCPPAAARCSGVL
ncbi:hypothetical protein Ctob_008748, partial [Chrysochromulina tobinii]